MGLFDEIICLSFKDILILVFGSTKSVSESAVRDEVKQANYYLHLYFPAFLDLNFPK